MLNVPLSFIAVSLSLTSSISLIPNRAASRVKARHELAEGNLLSPSGPRVCLASCHQFASPAAGYPIAGTALPRTADSFPAIRWRSSTPGLPGAVDAVAHLGRAKSVPPVRVL